MKWLLLFRPATIGPQITDDDSLIQPFAMYALLSFLALYLGEYLSKQTWDAAGYALPPRWDRVFYLNAATMPFLPAIQAWSVDLVARRFFELGGAFRRLVRLSYYTAVGIMPIYVGLTLVSFFAIDVTQLSSPSHAGMALAFTGAAFGLYSSLVGLYLVKSTYQVSYGTALGICIVGSVVLVIISIPSLIIFYNAAGPPALPAGSVHT